MRLIHVRTSPHISAPARIRQGGPRRRLAEQARTRRSRGCPVATTNEPGRCGQVTYGGGQVMQGSICRSAAPAARPSLFVMARSWAAAIQLVLLSVLAITAILA